jgi:uncharacterized membrane protein YbhN (UPF0104 family)/tRNA A-37 threonylcarbamoyl transferase component Bud32
VSVPGRRGFGHADERPYRRLTGDAIRLVLATLVVVFTAIRSGAPSASQRALNGFLTTLPDAFDGACTAVLAFGSLWGVGLALAAALGARRWRLGAMLGAAGVLAWWLARVMAFVDDGAGFFSAIADAFGGKDTAPYPAVRLAVLAAVILTAAPFISRPTRRIGQLLLLLLVPASVVLDAADVNAAVAGVAIGWGLAAALHLTFGSPAGRPTTSHIERALAELNAAVHDLRLAPDQPRGSTFATARLDDGRPVAVRVYGRDAADTQLVAKAWRTVAYKDSGPTWTSTRLQQVEHEALCLYAAHDAGVPVPRIVAAGVAGPSAALLASLRPAGVALSDLDPDPGDAWAPALWRAAGRMWDARIVHGALDTDHVIVDGDAVTIVEFDHGAISASPDAIAQDRAQALVTTALVLGAAPAIELLVGAVEPDGIRDVARYLTKPALTPATRDRLRATKGLLDELTELLADRIDEAIVRPVELRRVSPMTLVTIAALLFAVWIILGQVGSLSDLWATLKTADWPWLVLGFTLAQLTAVAFALTTIGSVPQVIALLPAIVLQMAVSFVNLVAPTGAASTIMNIRFLQKQGVEVGAATSSGVLVGLSGTITQFGLFVLTAFAVGQQGSLSQLGGDDRDGGALIVIGVFVVAAVIGIVLAIPALRRFTAAKVWPQVKGAIRNIWGILTTPRQLGLVLGGSVAAQLLYSLCLWCCLHAYGGSLSLGEIVFVNTSASFLASLIPAPGGIGIMEAALVGALTTFGIPSEIAVATAVTHRLFTTYLPPIWGSYATKWLVGNGYL